jgi:hypothetical protein
MNIFFQDPSYKNITFKSLEKGIKVKKTKKEGEVNIIKGIKKYLSGK